MNSILGEYAWPDSRFFDGKMGDGRIGGRKDSEGRSKRPGKRAPRRIEKHCYIIMTVLVDHVKHLLQRNLISLGNTNEIDRFSEIRVNGTVGVSEVKDRVGN